MSGSRKAASRWIVLGLGAAAILAGRLGFNPSRGQDGDRATRKTAATPTGKAIATEPVANSRARRTVPAGDAAQGVKTPSRQTAAQLAEVKETIRAHLLERCGGEVAMPNFPPQGTDAWCREQYAAAPEEPQARYALIAQHLMVADRMLKDRDVTRRRQGLGVAVEAGQFAATTLKDPELAGAIGDAYILANLDVADADHTRKWSRERVLQMATVVYLGAGQDAKVIACYRRLLAIAHNRNMADFARFKLAQALEQYQHYDEALTHLRAIDPDAGMAGVREFIPAVERKLEAQRSRTKSKPKTRGVR